MTLEEIAEAVADARERPAASATNTEALAALANLVWLREKLLDDWKVVMRRSPLGPGSPELRSATVDLMQAEENVRKAIGY